MLYQSDLEQKLVEQGYDAFTLEDKNRLITILANRNGLMYSDIAADYILTTHKNLKTELLSEDCENTIITGFTSSNGHKYRLNRDDQLNMIGQKDELMGDTTITTVSWRAEDVGAWIDHTRDEWLTVYKEGFAFKKNTLTKYNQLKAQVQQATTNAAVLAIVWS